jgi:hypothetical protein
MDLSNGVVSAPHLVKKQEDSDVHRDPKSGGSKPDGKPATKTLNRVPRAFSLLAKPDLA